MPKLVIKGTPIELVNSGGSPNWAPSVIEAIEALTDAVNSITGTFDIQPQVQNIDANNSSTDVPITNLSFPPTDVRSATVFYAVYRKTEDSGPPDGQEVAESGNLDVVYNDSRPATQKWEITRVGEGNAFIDFEITDTGQFTFTTSPLTGVNHTGIISFRALAVLNS